MPGLVAEEPHAQDAPQGPAQDGGQEQGPLRDPPLPPPGPSLVHPHQGESGQVGRQQIQPKPALHPAGPPFFAQIKNFLSIIIPSLTAFFNKIKAGFSMEKFLIYLEKSFRRLYNMMHGIPEYRTIFLGAV